MTTLSPNSLKLKEDDKKLNTQQHSKAGQYSTKRSERRKFSLRGNRKRENATEKPTTTSNEREFSVSR